MPVFVKPVGEKWGVFEMSIPQSLMYDLRHFGVKVALYNLAWLIKDKIKGG